MTKKLWKFFLLLAIFLVFQKPAKAQNFFPCTQSSNVGFWIPPIGNSTVWGSCINQDLGMLDVLLGGYQTLTVGSSTPSVAGYTNWQTANTTSTTITGFNNGFPGQTIHIICGPADIYTEIGTSSNIALVSAFYCSSSTGISLTYINGKWYEIGRAGGGSGGSGLTSVGLSTNASWLTITNSPLTANGTISLNATTGLPQNEFIATPNGSSGAVGLRAIVATDIPILNQNTTGSAGTAGSAAALSISGQTGLLTVTGLTSTNRSLTVRDASDTVLELGGSYTPTGTWNWATASATWPTFNQNTTGNAATATNLLSYPTLCSGGQFSQGLSSGSNNCATPSGGGGSINVNGSPVSNPNFNGTTPAAGTGYVNVNFQVSSSSISAEVPAASVGFPLISNQPSNGSDTFLGHRFTDTSPTGYWLRLQNAAQSANLFSVDASGNLTANSLTLINQNSLTLGTGSIVGSLIIGSGPGSSNTDPGFLEACTSPTNTSCSYLFPTSTGGFAISTSTPSADSPATLVVHGGVNPNTLQTFTVNLTSNVDQTIQSSNTFVAMTTIAASVTSDVATLTFGSNPTTNFQTGGTVTVSGFTGSDTYFNGTFPLTGTSSSTISYSLTHANASASSNGSVIGDPQVICGAPNGWLVFVMNTAASGTMTLTPSGSCTLNGSSGPLSVTAGYATRLVSDSTNLQGQIISNVSGAGTGTLTNFSAGNLSPLFTTSVANPTTTPSLTFTISSAAAYSLFGNNGSVSGAPSFTSTPAISSLSLEGSTSGSATLSASATGGTLNLGSTNATVSLAGALTVTSCSGCGGGSSYSPSTFSQTGIPFGGSTGDGTVYTIFTAPNAGLYMVHSTFIVTTAQSGCSTSGAGSGRVKWTDAETSATESNLTGLSVTAVGSTTYFNYLTNLASSGTITMDLDTTTVPSGCSTNAAFSIHSLILPY